MEQRTLYWDARDARWVLIVMNKPMVAHHKAPKAIVEKADAEAWADEVGKPVLVAATNVFDWIEVAA